MHREIVLKALRISSTLALAHATIGVQYIPGFNDDYIAMPKSFLFEHSSEGRAPTVYFTVLSLQLIGK